MVSLLEVLYAVTALSFVAAFVLMVRGQRAAARRLTLVGALCAVLALLLYWYLRPAA